MLSHFQEYILKRQTLIPVPLYDDSKLSRLLQIGTQGHRNIMLLVREHDTRLHTMGARYCTLDLFNIIGVCDGPCLNTDMAQKILGLCVPLKMNPLHWNMRIN